MIKTLKTLISDEREGIKPPKTANEILPLSRIWGNGLFLSGNRYSLSYRFPDINYAIASDEDRGKYSESFQRMINSLDPAVAVQFTIFNRVINRSSLGSVLHVLRGDANDLFRRAEQYRDIKLQGQRGHFPGEAVNDIVGQRQMQRRFLLFEDGRRRAGN